VPQSDALARIKGVLFDKDGTLIDFAASWVPAYEAGAVYLARHGSNGIDADALLRATGYEPETRAFTPESILTKYTSDQITEIWAGHAGIDLDANAGDLRREVKDVFDDVANRSLQAVTDLDVLFRALHGRGLAVGLATADSTASAEAALDTFGVAGLVDFVTGFDGGHGCKPGPGQVHGFCTALGLEPGAVMVVGDTAHDMEMGRNAGAGVVAAVLTGMGDRDRLIPLADMVLPSIAGLDGLFP
jgi:phosphoglycolate phosphatase